MSTVRSGRRPDRRSTSTTLKSHDVICGAAARLMTCVRAVAVARTYVLRLVDRTASRAANDVPLTRVRGVDGGGCTLESS